MMITYKVPREGYSTDHFLEEYVLPLGPSRASTSLDPRKGAKLELGAGDCLSLARVFLIVASGLNDDWEFTTVKEDPSGPFAGELMAGSVEFEVVRTGEPDHHEIHILEVPDQARPIELRWRKGAAMRVSDENEFFTIFGNSAALLSFAEHLAFLSSPKIPLGTKARYLPGRDLQPASLPLLVERT